MCIKTVKAIDVNTLPDDIKQTTLEWLKDLNRDFTNHMVEIWTEEDTKSWANPTYVPPSPLDLYLVECGLVDGDEILIYHDW